MTPVAATPAAGQLQRLRATPTQEPTCNNDCLVLQHQGLGSLACQSE